MTPTFEHKLITQHLDENMRVYRVTWQLIATYNNKSSMSEFTHTGPNNIHGELSDEQILAWIMDQIHPSDLNAMRAGLSASLAD